MSTTHGRGAIETWHNRNLEETMGDAKRSIVTCTHLMATANLQASARANAAIDGHAMNAIVFTSGN